MDPISAIGTAISSIKTAIDITQAMKASENKYSEFEYKLKLADIYNVLADAKMSIAEFKEILIKKDEEIKRLEEKFKEQKSISFHEKWQIYFTVDESGRISGKYCTRCYDDEKKLMRLDERDNGFSCKKCRSFYEKPEFSYHEE